MKRLTLLFLLSPVLLFSQSGWTIFDTLPSGATRIELPAAKNYFGVRGTEYLITDDSTYKASFADSVQSKLPVIDFRRYELIGKSRCMQCLITCHYYPQCHRNACHYTRLWYLLDKRHRTALHVDTLSADYCNLLSAYDNELIYTNDSGFHALKQRCPGLKNDSVNFDQSTVLVRSAFADCQADIQHELYIDTVNRCVVWRMFVGDGGCRGMLERDFILAVPKPDGEYRVVFEEYGGRGSKKGK